MSVIGWDVEADPHPTVTQTHDGQFALPVDVLLDRRSVARVPLSFTPEQIELLYRQIELLYVRGLIAAAASASESVQPQREHGQ